jgi:hypothetical protein
LHLEDLEVWVSADIWSRSDVDMGVEARDICSHSYYGMLSTWRKDEDKVRVGSSILEVFTFCLLYQYDVSGFPYCIQKGVQGGSAVVCIVRHNMEGHCCRCIIMHEQSCWYHHWGWWRVVYGLFWTSAMLCTWWLS